jgi:hypothetical protein
VRTQNLITNGLVTIKNKEGIDELFDPLISQENQIIEAMLDLYDEVNGIMKNYGRKKATRKQTGN